MDNQLEKKYFTRADSGETGKILDVCGGEALVVYDKNPRAEIISYNDANFVKSTEPSVKDYTDILRPGDLIITDLTGTGPPGTIQTVEKPKGDGVSFCSYMHNNESYTSPCSHVIPYSIEIKTKILNFNIKKRELEKQRQNRRQTVSSIPNNQATNVFATNSPPIDNLHGPRTRTYVRSQGTRNNRIDTNQLYNHYNTQNALFNVTTYENKIKAQMVTFFFNTFFEHYNNKRISIKPNTLFIICKSNGVVNFEGGRTYEISRENCPRVYTNIIDSIDSLNYSVIDSVSYSEIGRAHV